MTVQLLQNDSKKRLMSDGLLMWPMHIVHQLLLPTALDTWPFCHLMDGLIR